MDDLAEKLSRIEELQKKSMDLSKSMISLFLEDSEEGFVLFVTANLMSLYRIFDEFNVPPEGVKRILLKNFSDYKQRHKEKKGIHDK